VTAIDQLLLARLRWEAELLRRIWVQHRIERARGFPEGAQGPLQIPGQGCAFTGATPEEAKSVDLVASEIAHLQFHHRHLSEIRRG